MEKKSIRFKPPPEAKAFVIYRVGTSKTAHHSGQRIRMKGTPLTDGSVPDIWPVGEFSTQRVLEVWGPGRYKVEFYDGEDNLMKGQGHLFDVAFPEGKEPRSDRKLRPPKRERTEEDEPSAAPAAAGGIGFLELLTLLRGEREEADRRAEAAKERDRDFYAAQQAQQTQLLTILLGNRSSGPDANVLGQQMNLAIQQGMLGIRQQLFAQQREDAENEEPEDPDPNDPPQDLEDAGSRIGLAFFREIEHNAPHLLRELVPTVVEWLKPKGFQPSANLQQQIAATLRHRNGAGHADGS